MVEESYGGGFVAWNSEVNEDLCVAAGEYPWGGPAETESNANANL